MSEEGTVLLKENENQLPPLRKKKHRKFRFFVFSSYPVQGGIWEVL